MKSKPENIVRAVKLIEDEAQRAIKKFPRFNSGHEGKAVIEEELDELWEEIKKYPNGNDADLLIEAIQVGAMAARFIADVIMDSKPPIK